MMNKNTRRIIEISTIPKSEIFMALSNCADSLYNQNYNNPLFLEKQAEKYSKSAIVRGAYYKNELVGFVAMYANDIEKKEAFISMIVVLSICQGLGIGSMLIEDAIDICKNNQMEKLLLEVDKNNNTAIAFYKKKGFSLLTELSNSSHIYYRNI